RDTPERAAAKRRAYLAEYRRDGAETAWHFLVGDEPEIRRLTDAIGFRYRWDEASQQYAHASGIVLATPAGRLAQYFYGVEFSPRDLRLALVESSQERIGTLVDQLLLYCFHYDPATGTYSRLALDVVRAGGILTLIALGAFVGLMLRRDARRRRAPQPGGSAA
ncbi:MAG: SCO family protein, partial [Anaerolineae bacterium]|nr:SCO family protein [Anaerolineae bacterium]